MLAKKPGKIKWIIITHCGGGFRDIVGPLLQEIHGVLEAQAGEQTDGGHPGLSPAKFGEVWDAQVRLPGQLAERPGAGQVVAHQRKRFEYPPFSRVRAKIGAVLVNPGQPEQAGERSGQTDQRGLIKPMRHMLKSVFKGLEQNRRIPHGQQRCGIGNPERPTVVIGPLASEMDPAYCPWKSFVSSIDVILFGWQKQDTSRLHPPFVPGQTASARTGDADNQDMLGSPVFSLHKMSSCRRKMADMCDTEIASDRLANRSGNKRARDDHQALSGKSLGTSCESGLRHAQSFL